MAGIERARTVGELIRPADGTVWPLILPITLIGSGDRCDVKISGSGIAELHCALALTPAGLTLRSWNPEFTLLDGQPTAAAVLSDGREIRIGSEMFRLSWNVPVAPEDSASPVALLSQLHIAREQFRLEREAADAETGLRTKQSRKAESKVREGEIAVALDKKRVRALYETCLRKLKSKWVAERASCERTRADTGAAEARFREYAERTRLELDRREERLRDDRARLKAAWELLADGQRRALADRAQAEEWTARHREALDLRAKMLTEQHALSEGRRSGLEARQPQLIAEIAGLEARATHLRHALGQLETRREKLSATEVSPGTFQSRVSLNPSPPSFGTDGPPADDFMGQLQLHGQELARERQTLAQARGLLEARAFELHDGRAILAEQVAALATARELWRDAEAQTVEELHALALGVRSGERSLEERERILLAADRRRRSEDHTLGALRFKLENWQAALLAKESSVETEAAKLEEALAVQVRGMKSREATLAETAATWNGLRQHELAFYRAELDRVSVAGVEAQAVTAEMREARHQQAERLRDLAARELAQAESGRSEGSSRRLRILERRWKAHFVREEKRLERRESRLTAERADCDARLRQLQSETVAFLERQGVEMEKRSAHELARLAENRRLSEAEQTAALEAELRFRTEGDARRLRGQIARIAESIQTADLIGTDGSDIIALAAHPTQAA